MGTLSVNSWGSWTDFTLTAASLASDTNLLAGRASTVATLANVLDVQIAGQITVGTTPTANTQIEVWVYGDVSNTPTYPDGITGTDANKTITSTEIKYAGLGGIRRPQAPLAIMKVDSTTSNRAYTFGPVSIRSVFGDLPPAKLGIFIVHNTGAALNATAGNHFVRYRAIYLTY